MCVIVGGGGAGRNGVPNGVYVTCLEPVPEGEDDNSGGVPGALVFRHPGHSIVDTGPELPSLLHSPPFEPRACSLVMNNWLYAPAQEVGMDLVGDRQTVTPMSLCCASTRGHDLDETAEDRIVTCGSDRTVRVFNCPLGDTKARVHCDAELSGIMKGG